MAADITLSVGLDPKDVNQGIKDIEQNLTNLERRVQNLFNRMGSNNNNNNDVTPQVDTTALEAANREISELRTQLNELYSRQQTGTLALQGANAQIQELQNSLGGLQAELFNSGMGNLSEMLYAPEAEQSMQRVGALYRELLEIQEQLSQGADLPDAQQRIQAIGTEMSSIVETLRASGQIWTRPEEEVRRLSARVAQLEQQVRSFSGETRNVRQNATQMVAAFGGGNVGGAIASGLNGALHRAFRMLRRMGTAIVGITLGVRGIQAIINRIRGMIQEGFHAIYEGDKKFKKQVDDLKKSWEEVNANLAAAFMPIVQMAIPYIQQLINWINMLIDKIAMFVAAIAGQNSYTKAIKATGDAAKGAAKQLSKFDELNNLTTSGQSDWSTKQVPIDAKMLELAEKFKAILEEIKQKFQELVVNPFKEGFNSTIGDWQTKLEKIRESFKGIGKSMKDIFTDPQVTKSMEKFTKTLFKYYGSIAGVIGNCGITTAMIWVGGFEKFLNDNKDDIKQRLIDIFDTGTNIADNWTQMMQAISQIIDKVSESESAINTAANIFAIFWDVLSGGLLIIEKLYEAGQRMLFPMIIDNVPLISAALTAFMELLEKVTGFVKTVISDLITHILDFIDRAVMPVADFLGRMFSQIMAWILRIWLKVQPLFTWLFESLTMLWQEYVNPVITDIIDIVSELVEVFLPIIEENWNRYVAPVVDAIIEYVLPVVVEQLREGFAIAFALIAVALVRVHDFLEFIKRVIKAIGVILNTDFATILRIAGNAFYLLFIKPVIDRINLLKDVFNEFRTFLHDIFTGLVSLGVGAANGLIMAIEGLYNRVVDFLNGLKFDVPDWVPEIGGRSFGGFNIGRAEWERLKVPALATGAVIPPSMGNFIAKLGDNNNETEVVSPLSTMKQALMEALQETGGTGEYHIHVDVDGREIAKAVVRQNDMYKKSVGRTLFA